MSKKLVNFLCPSSLVDSVTGNVQIIALFYGMGRYKVALTI